MFEGMPIPGATEKVYALPKVMPADFGSYGVQVTNDCGTVESESSELSQLHRTNVERLLFVGTATQTVNLKVSLMPCIL